MSNSHRFAQTMSTREILDAQASGEIILCQVCNTPIRVISAGEKVTDFIAAPGIYCPMNVEHLEVRFNVGLPRGYWDKFRK